MPAATPTPAVKNSNTNNDRAITQHGEGHVGAGRGVHQLGHDGQLAEVEGQVLAEADSRGTGCARDPQVDGHPLERLARQVAEEVDQRRFSAVEQMAIDGVVPRQGAVLQTRGATPGGGGPSPTLEPGASPVNAALRNRVNASR